MKDKPDRAIYTRRPSRYELAADRWIHVVGTSLGVAGAVALIVNVAAIGNVRTLIVAAIYAVGLVSTMICSAAYNLARPSTRKDLLRRLDHAAIFLMIAGSYTPFTTLFLSGAWCVAITSMVWAVALIGIVIKLAAPRRFERAFVLVYLALGWTVLLTLRPLVAALDAPTLALIVTGGILYSVGTLFHLLRRLPFQNAIWHLFVLVAALLHYLAVFRSVA
jgi:hemolysin III